MHLDRHLSLLIQKSGCVECDDVAFMLERLKDAGGAAVFLDVGANIGMYSLAAAAKKHE